MKNRQKLRERGVDGKTIRRIQKYGRHLEDLSVDEIIILKHVYKNSGGEALTRSI
jgi:hypothetical protein